MKILISRVLWYLELVVPSAPETKEDAIHLLWILNNRTVLNGRISNDELSAVQNKTCKQLVLYEFYLWHLVRYISQSDKLLLYLRQIPLIKYDICTPKPMHSFWLGSVGMSSIGEQLIPYPKNYDASGPLQVERVTFAFFYTSIMPEMLYTGPAFDVVFEEIRITYSNLNISHHLILDSRTSFQNWIFHAISNHLARLWAV